MVDSTFKTFSLKVVRINLLKVVRPNKAPYESFLGPRGGIYCDRPSMGVRMHPMLFSSSNYFAWKIPSRDKSNRLLWNSSSSHLRIEKSDSTDVELGKTVANPTEK